MTNKEWDEKMKGIKETNSVFVDINKGKKEYNGLTIHRIMERHKRAKIENPDYDWSDEERDYYEG